MKLIIVRNPKVKNKFDIVSTDNIKYNVEYSLLSYEDAAILIETYNSEQKEQ